MNTLLKLDEAFNWMEKHQFAFNTLNEILIQDPVLQYPDFDKPVLMRTDASAYAIGTILSQEKIGTDRPIAYVSRVSNDCEKKYAIYEKEALAIVSQFRPHVYGRKFKLVTDSKPLFWFQSSKNANSRVLK